MNDRMIRYLRVDQYFFKEHFLREERKLANNSWMLLYRVGYVFAVPIKSKIHVHLIGTRKGKT